METVQVIHCRTREQWQIVLGIFHVKKWTWVNGDDPFIGLVWWNDYHENTCVRYEDKFGFGSIHFYENRDEYQIISFEEFKESLKPIEFKRTR